MREHAHQVKSWKPPVYPETAGNLFDFQLDLDAVHIFFGQERNRERPNERQKEHIHCCCLHCCKRQNTGKAIKIDANARPRTLRRSWTFSRTCRHRDSDLQRKVWQRSSRRTPKLKRTLVKQTKPNLVTDLPITTDQEGLHFAHRNKRLSQLLKDLRTLLFVDEMAWTPSVASRVPGNAGAGAFDWKPPPWFQRRFGNSATHPQYGWFMQLFRFGVAADEWPSQCRHRSNISSKAEAWICFARRMVCCSGISGPSHCKATLIYWIQHTFSLVVLPNTRSFVEICIEIVDCTWNSNMTHRHASRLNPSTNMRH